MTNFICYKYKLWYTFIKLEEKNMKIKKEDLAKYISHAFDNEYIEQLTLDSKSRSELYSQLINLSRFIFTYVTSTSDLSEESLNTILNDFINHKDELENKDLVYGKNESVLLKEYFGNYILPVIENQYKKEHKIEGPLSLVDYNNIYREMVVNSKNNTFFTHSFSGALLDEISTNGLDAKGEKFQDELRFLSYFGFKTPYNRGKLHLTDLSCQTIGYALQPSERARMVLTSKTDLSEDDSETSLEYYNRVIENLKIEDCDEEELETIKEYLTEINNFYFSNNKSCIAVIEKEKNPEDDIHILPLFRYVLSNRYKYQELLESDETFKAIYEKTDSAIKEGSDKSIEILELLANYMHTKYEGSKETAALDQTIKDEFIGMVITCATNHFEEANGEGYIVDSGHISPDKFAIATITNPLLYYPEYKKSQEIEIKSSTEVKQESEEKKPSK